MKIFLTGAIAALTALSCLQLDKQADRPIRFSMDENEAQVYTTSAGTDLRMQKTGALRFEKAVQPFEYEAAVFVQPDKQFQTFLGIGGAITDASAEVFAQLDEVRQQELIDAYFSHEKGVGYTLLRVPIHSCDFSSESFIYIEEGDRELESFSIDHDRQYRIPMIKRAFSAADNLLLYASPWSPPAFMKSNGSMLQGGSLLPGYYDAWAGYYVKFIEAYEREGMPVWGLTIQNEPMAVQRWESCIYTAEQERDFLKHHLGPALHRAGMGDKKVIVWDHNRDLINHRANTIFSDPEAARYAWGIGFHWYETWAGGDPMFVNLQKVQEAYPDKKLIFTEGCAESFSPGKYESIQNAEKYGRSMINDFNAGTVGWTDWNILLDQRGGPNHVGNFCFAPMHADVTTGELLYTLSYYYIGHFSKFIRPGARRVSAAASRSHLLTTAFLNTDGSLAVVIMNHTGEPVAYKLMITDYQAEISIEPHSIQTVTAAPGDNLQSRGS